MALDQRKRQKQAEKRNAKRKAHKKTLIARQGDDLTLRVQRGSAMPILHCCVNKTLWEQGMGTLLLSRGIPGGDIVYAGFLLDTYCLGVKDVFLNYASWNEYQSNVAERLLHRGTMVDLTPPAALKILDGAVEFARSYGLPPAGDYSKGRLLFGSIDSSECQEVFVFGKNGKPVFISGPHDSSQRVNQILSAISKHSGLQPAEHFEEQFEVDSDLDSFDADDDFDDEFDDDDFGTGLGVR